MKIEEITITPAMAAQMLEKNTRNRPLNVRHVRQLAGEMAAGRWKENGDTICLNGNLLIDGQHRLSAVVESGMSIRAILVSALPDNVFDTKDCGRKRTGADTLHVQGEKNVTQLAGALTVIGHFLSGNYHMKTGFTNTQIEELLRDHPGCRRSVNVVGKTYKHISPSLLSGLHYLFSLRDSTMADKFVNDLITGLNLTNIDPVYHLRERLGKNAVAKGKLTKEYIAALCVKAWNCRRRGEVCRQLRFSQEGIRTEEFPEIQ